MRNLLSRLFRRSTFDGLEAVARKAPEALDASIEAIGRSRTVQRVAPAVMLATSAGVAVWWWTQWARGRAESEAASKDDDNA